MMDTVCKVFNVRLFSEIETHLNQSHMVFNFNFQNSILKTSYHIESLKNNDRFKFFQTKESKRNCRSRHATGHSQGILISYNMSHII